MDSVRYGIVGSYIAKRNISEGEEIFANYGPYYANIFERNSWYYYLWQRYKKENPDKKKLIQNFEDEAKKFYA